MIGGRSSSERESTALPEYLDDTSIMISRSKDLVSAARILSVRNSGSGEVKSEGDVENSGGESDLVQMDDELRSFAAVAVDVDDGRELVRLLPGFCCFVDFLGGSGGDRGGEL